MAYNPQIHHRRSIRLKGYDYSQAGLYFITICTQNRAFLFGKIERGEMKLNDAGRMIEKWYYELENKYPDKRCHEMVVMPNHFHCIIENIPMDAITMGAITMGAHGGAPLRGRPDNDERGHHDNDERGHHDNDERGHHDNDERGHHDNDERGHHDNDERGHHDNNKYGINNKKFNATIGDAIDWFKTMTTNEYIRGVKNNNWQSFYKKLWQRNYYERIIRDENAYLKISDYIINNPVNWGKDSLK